MAQDKGLHRKEIPLTGKLITSVDPSTIDTNFQTLKNLRYTDTGLRAIGGMSVLNSTAITTYTNIRNGFHYTGESGNSDKSHVLVQAFNSGETGYAIYQNNTAIPSTGDFAATALYTDTTNTNTGYFSYAPDKTVAFCDSENSMIWGGDEARCSGFINYDGSAASFTYDFTKEVSNSSTDSLNIATLTSVTADKCYFYVGSLRPLKGIKLYIGQANAATATLSGTYWKKSTNTWTALGTFVDNTASGGVTLAQTGTLTWDDHSDDTGTNIIDGSLLYWYKFESNVVLTASPKPTITQCTLDAKFQNIKDVWGGDYAVCTSFIHHLGGDYLEYAPNVYEQDYTSVDTASFMQLGGLVAADSVRPGFQEQMSGMHIELVGGTKNTASATTSVEYWDGGAWVTVPNLVDGTKKTNAFDQSGTITWSPPAKSAEFKRNLTGTPHYYYKLKVNATLSADCKIDFIGGIPAPKDIDAYEFPLFAHGRLFLCGNKNGKENTALASAYDSSAVFNGDDSIELIFGDESKLTAGVELFRQFGSSLYNLTVFCKVDETWAVIGNNPEDWVQYKVSDSIGCVAPLTMARSHSEYEVAPGQNRYVAIWQAANGVYMFDGSTFMPIHSDISDIFDQRNSNAINTNAITKSTGAIDEINQEYHWCFASGTSTTLDKEFVYDLKRKKWYEVDRGTGEQLQSIFQVRDTSGNPYLYGGENEGKIYRLDNGNDFDGNDIVCTFHTGDIALNEGSIFVETEVRKVKLVSKCKTTTANTISFDVYSDGNNTSGLSGTMPVNRSGFRTIDTVRGHGNNGGIFHSFKFSLTTNDETIGFEPLYAGTLYKKIRLDTV